MYRQQFFAIRQNPYANTDQRQMRDFNISQNIVTCPFGHLSEERNNVVNGTYNEEHPEWKSQSQDRQFIENMNIGDIIVIPYAKIKECILARIVSAPIYSIDTGLFTTVMRDGKIHISNEGETPFRPVGRRIEIIDRNLIFADKRCLTQKSFCKINPNILPLQ
jgi:hypothetical protein